MLKMRPSRECCDLELPPDDGRRGRDELRGAGVREDEPGASRLDGTPGDVVGVKRGQHEYRGSSGGRWIRRMASIPSKRGHPDVHQDDVGSGGFDLDHRWSDTWPSGAPPSKRRLAAWQSGLCEMPSRLHQKPSVRR